MNPSSEETREYGGRMKDRTRGITDLREARSLLAVVILLLGLAAIVVSGMSLGASGIGWDSRYNTAAALATRGVSPDSSLAEAYEAVPETSEFYGTFIYQAADAIHTMRGGSTAAGSTQPLGPDDPATYQYQGLVNLLLALIAVTALAIALSLALRSVLAGAVAWSLTLSTPLWLGLSHIDFKDVPVAAGLTLISAGLILSLVRRDSAKATTAGVLLAGAGGAISLATRSGSLVLILGLVAGTALIALSRIQEGRRLKSVWPTLFTGTSAVAGALAFTWATNPIARIEMFGWLWDAFETNRLYPWVGTTRTAGVDVLSTEIPLWYLPAWLMAQLPLLTLISLAAAIGLLLVTLFERRELFRSATFVSLTPVILQGLILPGIVVLSGAVLYDATRHLLFMIPALMAVPAIAVTLIERKPPAWLTSSLVLPGACVVVIAFSLFASIRWAPYSYAFVNPLAGLAKGAWEIDYWGTSGREGVTRLNDLGLDRTRVRPQGDVGVPWGGEENAPGLSFDQQAEEVFESDEDTGLYLFIRGPDRVSDYGCELIFEIKRDGQLLGQGARCPPSP